MHLHCKILRSQVTGMKTQDGYTPGPQNDWLLKSQSLENHVAHSAPHYITTRVQRVTDAQGKGGSPHTPLPWGPIPTPIHRPAPASCKVTYPILIRTQTALPPSPGESPEIFSSSEKGRRHRRGLAGLLWTAAALLAGL